MLDDEFIFADAEIMDNLEEQKEQKPEQKEEPEPKQEQNEPKQEQIIIKNMTSTQKELALQVYSYTKPVIKNIFYNNISNTVKITKMISQIMKRLDIIIDRPSGIDKKIVTIELCNIFIKEFKCNIILTYEMIDAIIEDIIDASKVINVNTETIEKTEKTEVNDKIINVISGSGSGSVSEKNIFKRIEFCPTLRHLFRRNSC